MPLTVISQRIFRRIIAFYLCRPLLSLCSARLLPVSYTHLMGLSPIFVNEIFNIIKDVSESGTTVLLVEQNAKKALSIADRAYVLETGNITLEGKATDLLHNEAVQKAYLGE